ncbi:MAG: aminotransferase class III-fold pyridoxal phosphate-dependent enzyme [Actinomycetota bacterium]
MGLDDVLSTAPPALPAEEAAALALELFGAEGTATAVGSERDQTFVLGGPRPAVMKISNEAEDPARLDMEARAAFHALAADPGLAVATPWAALRTDPSRGPAAYRASIPSATGGVHQVRMYARMPGTASVDESTLSDAAVSAWGETAARLGRALRGFFDPGASRAVFWDPQHALALRPLVSAVADHRMRALIERTLDRYEAVVVPGWSTLRHQVIHGDLCADNMLVDDDGVITGIIDFGDMSFTALVVDLAAVIESLVSGRSGDEVLRVARMAMDGFERVLPLEPGERAILGELVAARSCAASILPSWRSSMYEDPEAFAAQYHEDAFELLKLFDEMGFEDVARRLGGREPGTMVAFDDLVGRRANVLGSALTGLSYAQPLHIVRGEGPWLFDHEDRRYLDAYNNVPVVGHCHPRVTGAIARQARVLNTNMRYLHATVLDLAERLVATTEGELDTVMFVNSGSEANDLAWRIAIAATGNSGGLCTAYAYHGVSETTTWLSPEAWSKGARPDHVETWRPPDAYRGLHMDPSEFPSAIARLAERGHAPAVAILDGVLTSDGILDLDPEYVTACVDALHRAGGLWIADEVQGGHGRTGDAMWSYQRLGIAPDFVTIGKPMGNGHPVAAVITRSDIVDRFAETTDYFSTFGGNPVSTAAASAVLDVIEDERLLNNAREVGTYLLARLLEVKADHPIIGDVRGMGLACGVEIVTDPASKQPDAGAAERIINGLRQHGVLVGTTGAADNTLKVRPPLVFGRAEADLLVETLRDVLTGG